MAECLLAPAGAVDAPYLNVRSFRVDVDGLAEGCSRSVPEISARDQRKSPLEQNDCQSHRVSTINLHWPGDVRVQTFAMHPLNLQIASAKARS